MATSLNNFEINGVIDTKQSVLNNIQSMATACASWLSFDGTKGKWVVVINKPGSSIKSFNDNNIIGNINVSGTGIQEMYNAVSVQFPHADLNGQTDYVDYEIPLANRFPNEQDNTLNIKIDCINNPVQAQYIGIVNLKQSRMDKIIQFTTDYSSIGLKAGDIIDITADMYGFSSKPFRITSLDEDDAGDGNINIVIKGVEYSDDVYSDAGLVRKERTKKTGITPKSSNDVLTDNDRNALNSVNWRKLWNLPHTHCATDSLWHDMSFGLSYTAPYTGYYQCRVLFNWGAVDRGGGAVADPPTGIGKLIKLYVNINGNEDIPGVSDNNSTGSRYSPMYDDYVLVIYFQATKGDTLIPKYSYASDWGPTWTPPAGYPSYGTVSTDHAVIGFTGELEYVGTKIS